MGTVADKYRARHSGAVSNPDSAGSLASTLSPARQVTEQPEGSVAAKYRKRHSTGVTHQEPVAAEAPKGPDNSNWVDRVNAAGQGASFGFADELGSGIAAGAAKTVVWCRSALR